MTFLLIKTKKIITDSSWLNPTTNGQSSGSAAPYTAQLTLHADNYNQVDQVITLDSSWSSETKKAICDKFYLADNDTTDNIVWSLDETGCLKSVSN